jgi:hypothetical protein
MIRVTEANFQRLQGCRKNIEQWQRILIVRSLVLSHNELRPLWIKFASMCRRQGKHSISRRVLRSLLDISQDTSLERTAIPFDKPHLALAVCKQLWIDDSKKVALSNLENLTTTMHRLIERNRAAYSREQLEPMARITAKCYLKLGEWNSSSGQTTLFQPSTPNFSPLSRHPSAHRSGSDISPRVNPAASPINLDHSTKLVLQYYTNATSFDPTWYKACWYTVLI